MKQSSKSCSICFVLFLLKSVCWGAWTNSIGMVFVEIPTAAPTKEAGNAPAPHVGADAARSGTPKTNYWLSVTETTQDQWLLVMGNNPSHNKGKSLPVEKVSWEQAVEFCRRLSRQDGFVYRLPTEAEWEFACRCGRNNSVVTNLAEYAWTLENATNSHPVGELSPNPWGLFDMQGNVAEWCLDVKEWKDDRGVTRNDLRVVKGGAFSYYARDSQPMQSMSYPGGMSEDYRAGFIGLRVLREQSGTVPHKR